jgi:hypothetical protein
MVEIHLYGKLRRFAQEYRPREDTVILLEPGPVDTIGSLLERIKVPVDEINHIFFNARLLASRNRMASFYMLPQSEPDPSDWDLQVAVGDGDRLGLFGTDMAILGM